MIVISTMPDAANSLRLKLASYAKQLAPELVSILESHPGKDLYLPFGSPVHPILTPKCRTYSAPPFGLSAQASSAPDQAVKGR
jgi:hypothetical protein